MKLQNILACSVTATLLFSAGCSSSSPEDAQQDTGEIATESAVQIGQIHTIDVEGVSFTSLPDEVADRSSASQALGRLLFWDPILSGDMDIACGTCHLPEFGYADGRALSAGTGGVGAGPSRTVGQLGQTRRNAQTALNTVWNGINEFGLFSPESAPMFWDNRTQSLALQAIEPIRAEDEMRGSNFDESVIEATIVDRLANNSEYQVLFEAAFGAGTISIAQVGQALSDFQSTLIANNTPFDRWMRGDTTAMNQQQLNGMRVFAQTGCADCHSGPMFSDYDTHVLGVREADGLNAPDTGDGNFGFRTPTLRQLAFTAPYFHGGQDGSLNDVLDFYDNPGTSENPNVRRDQLAPEFLALPNINNAEKNAIVSFLSALNDSGFDRTRPASVPSGLPVGGSL